MTYIHFTGVASDPQLTIKRTPTMTQPTASPSYLTLFNCLKRMIPIVNYPRLRFVLSRNDPDAHLDFYYFPEDDAVHLQYRERHHGSIYLGPIESTGHFTPRPFPDASATHINDLLMKLSMDFRAAVESYGHNTHLCALCGLPLVDPSSLARGTTPNCSPHLIPEADLDDI